jgi:hypothetical protein
MANPPRVMVLMVMPNFSMTMTAVSSESGMAMSEMQAVRTLPSNRKSTTATRMPPRASECFMFASAVSMKVAGRCSRK